MDFRPTPATVTGPPEGNPDSTLPHGVWAMALRLLACMLWGLLAACAQAMPALPDDRPTPVEPVRILAAASLIEPFTALGRLWEQQVPTQPIAFNFASSHYLVLQLIQGAPGDLLATADRAQIDKAIAAGLVRAQDVTPLARNGLALAVHPQAAFTITGLQDLAQPGVRLAWARPGVPLAAYTAQLLASPEWELTDTVRHQIADNILTYDANARSVRNRLLQGEVDAAILYVSDALAVQNRLDVVWLEPTRNVEAVFYMAPVHGSSQHHLSQDFMNLALSAQGRSIMQQFGFAVYESE